MYFVRILDDFGHELEMTDSKLQQTVLKVEKVLRLSDGGSYFHFMFVSGLSKFHCYCTVEHFME